MRLGNIVSARAAMLCVALICAMLASASATELDLSDMTLEQLYSAREEIDARINALEQSGNTSANTSARSTWRPSAGRSLYWKNT